MKTPGISWLALLFCFSAFIHFTARAATLGEMSGLVLVSSEAQEREARPGQTVQGAFISTGPDSRVHIDLDERSFVRLGAESRLEIFNDREVRLQSGSAVFGQSNGKQLEVIAGDLKAAVNSGTAFATMSNGEGFSAAIGALAGEVSVRAGAKKHALKAGSVVAGGTDGTARVRAFNLPKQIETSRLVRGFENPLPTAAQVEAATARYVSLERRGFVRAHPDRSVHLALPEAGLSGTAFAEAKTPVHPGDIAPPQTFLASFPLPNATVLVHSLEKQVILLEVSRHSGSSSVSYGGLPPLPPTPVMLEPPQPPQSSGSSSWASESYSSLASFRQILNVTVSEPEIPTPAVPTDSFEQGPTQIFPEVGLSRETIRSYRSLPTRPLKD
jgi:hypothetical protein